MLIVDLRSKSRDNTPEGTLQCFDNIDYSNCKLDQPVFQFRRFVHFLPLSQINNQHSAIINQMSAGGEKMWKCESMIIVR